MIVTGATTRRGEEKRRRDITRRRTAMPMFAGSGTPTRAPQTPPPTRMPQTSSSPKVFSFYVKNGFFGAGYNVREYSVIYENMCYSKDLIPVRCV